MKKLLILFFCSITLNSFSQKGKEITAGKLVEIIEKADFISLVKLISSLNYSVLDSSKSKDGSLFYFAKEPKLYGNTLGCSTDAKIRVIQLTLMTYVEGNYSELKKELKSLGFKSSGVHKENPQKDIIESEDFEKGKIVALAAIRKSQEGPLMYEFTFVKW
jgi:hypothetical protein